MSPDVTNVPLYDAAEINGIRESGQDMYDLIGLVFEVRDVFDHLAYTAVVDAASELGFDFEGNVSGLIDETSPETASEIWCSAMRALGFTEEYDA